MKIKILKIPILMIIGIAMYILFMVMLRLSRKSNISSNLEEDIKDREPNRSFETFNSPYHILSGNETGDVIPIVIFVCDRPLEFTKTLHALFNGLSNFTQMEKLKQDEWDKSKHVQHLDRFLVIISYDRNIDEMRQVMHHWKSKIEKHTILRDKVEIFEILFDVESCNHFVPSIYSNQLKHRSFLRLKCHWFWAVKLMFDVNEFNGDVLFLEEDHLISSDAFVVMSKMLYWKNSGYVPNLFAVSLSYNGKSFQSNAEDAPYQFELMDTTWAFPNSGYAFNQSSWKRIRGELSHFFAFPSDWDNSLGHLMNVYSLLPTFIMIPTLSRVYHIGKTGLTMNPDLFEKLGYSDAKYSLLQAHEFDVSRAYISSMQSHQNYEYESHVRIKSRICGNNCPLCHQCPYCHNKQQHWNCHPAPTSY